MADKQFSTYTSEQVQITEVGDGIIPVANADGLTTKGKINGSDLANDVQLQFNDYVKIYETTMDKDGDMTTFMEGDIIFDKETKKEYIIGSDGSAGSAVEVVEFNNSINDLINQNTDNIGVNSDNIATNTTAIAFNTAKVSADGSIDTHSDVDTSTTAPTAGQGLVWNDTTGKWEPADLSSSSGGSSDEYISTIVETKQFTTTGTNLKEYIIDANGIINGVASVSIDGVENSINKNEVLLTTSNNVVFNTKDTYKKIEDVVFNKTYTIATQYEVNDASIPTNNKLYVLEWGYGKIHSLDITSNDISTATNLQTSALQIGWTKANKFYVDKNESVILHSNTDNNNALFKFDFATTGDINSLTLDTNTFTFSSGISITEITGITADEYNNTIYVSFYDSSNVKYITKISYTDITDFSTYTTLSTQYLNSTVSQLWGIGVGEFYEKYYIGNDYSIYQVNEFIDPSVISSTPTLYCNMLNVNNNTGSGIITVDKDNKNTLLQATDVKNQFSGNLKLKVNY